MPTVITLIMLWLKWKDEDYFWEDLSNVLYGFFFLCYFFSTCIIYANYFSINSNYEVKKVVILDKFESSRGKRGGPYVPVAVVKYLDQKIRLNFHKDEFDRLEQAKYILIEVKEGNLGYGVIKKYDIDDGQEKWR